MILNIISDLILKFNENMSSDLLNAIPFNFIFFFLISIFVLFFILFISYFLFPLLKPNPERLYKKYLYLRDEMKRIDDLYSQKKLLFKEYVYMQFLNAHEYQKVIKLLSSNKEYKSKLESYTLQENYNKVKQKESVASKQLSKSELEEKQISKLCDVLKPKAIFYSKEDIYAVLLSEGFKDNVIKKVIEKLLSLNIIFSEKSSLENKKDLTLFLDDLFKGDKDSIKPVKSYETSGSIFAKKVDSKKLFEDDFKRKELNFNNISDVDYTLKNVDKEPEKKKGFFKRLFSSSKKEKEDSVSTIKEIDVIFKDIEKELKKKNL